MTLRLHLDKSPLSSSQTTSLRQLLPIDSGTLWADTLINLLAAVDIYTAKDLANTTSEALLAQSALLPKLLTEPMAQQLIDTARAAINPAKQKPSLSEFAQQFMRNFARAPRDLRQRLYCAETYPRPHYQHNARPSPTNEYDAGWER